MAYIIEYSSLARRSIKKLPVAIRKRILSRLEQLQENPRALGCTKLEGTEDYRVRVGDYRIIYSIIDQQLLVVIVEVGHRRDIYRR